MAEERLIQRFNAVRQELEVLKLQRAELENSVEEVKKRNSAAKDFIELEETALKLTKESILAHAQILKNAQRELEIGKELDILSEKGVERLEKIIDQQKQIIEQRQLEQEFLEDQSKIISSVAALTENKVSNYSALGGLLTGISDSSRQWWESIQKIGGPSAGLGTILKPGS